MCKVIWFVRKVFFLCFIVWPLGLSANGWVPVIHGGDSASFYEISLINESGFFTKEFDVWLKITHSIDERKCGATPSRSSSSYDRDLPYYAVCMSGLLKKPKEEVYRVRFNCKDRLVMPYLSSSVNIRGEAVSPVVLVRGYPGSIGYTLMQHYCN